MPKPKPGHPSVFTSAQNKALRGALRDLAKAESLSQVVLGQRLGISQQVAGRLLGPSKAGFGYGPATRLVTILGFAGVDEFFAAKGVAARPVLEDASLHAREAS